MKTWLIAIAGMVLFIGMALQLQYHIQTTADQFEHSIQQATTTLNQHQWRPTSIKISQIKTRWQKTKLLWAMLIIHREIDSIDQALIRSAKAVQSKNYSEALMELDTLRHFIQHIPERERFNLVNIF
jgi:hypothetical protein